MKPRFLCAAILLSVCGGGSAADWKAGAAKAVITPTEPMYLAGFASREVPAEGTAMDLHAKALAIEDTQGTRFVMVTLDLVEVTHQLREAVVAEVKTRYGLAPESLLLNCSHTHCGPELRHTELEFRSFTDPLRKERCLRYNAWLTDRIVGVVGEAIQGLEPATVSHGRARCAIISVLCQLPVDYSIGPIFTASTYPTGQASQGSPA